MELKMLVIVTQKKGR